MNILILDSECLGLDFAMRCSAAGHSVRWFRYSKKPTKDGNGFHGFKIIDDWRSSMAWARSGLIFLTGNCRFLEEVDRFRDLGFEVFGPTAKSAELEINRGLGMQAMIDAGIDVPPYEVFDSMAAAEKFAMKSDKSYVFKVLDGSVTDKALTYVSSDPADLVGWLRRNMKAGKSIKKCMLQEKIDADFEIGINGWFGPNGFLPERYQLSWEHKPLLPGDIGPNCFTPDAEVLTLAGWKAWPDVTMSDEICTLKDGVIVYDRPSQIVVGDFDGEMVGWLSPTVDILVTPGHQMYVQDDHYRKPYFFEDAIKSFENRRTIMRAGGAWCGAGSDTSATAWAALLGIYIADGYCHKAGIVFGSCPSHKQPVFSEIIRVAGYEPKLYGNDLSVNSKHLRDILKPLGKALEKHVPQYIKDASPPVIRAFLRGYAAGDGTRRENNLTFTTISKRLADDVHELCLKVGWAAAVATRDRVGEQHEINGYMCINRHIAYDIRVSKQKHKSEISPDNRYREKYSGKVYCCTVPSHVIYVRRNGKSCWIGQTGEMISLSQYVTHDKLVDDFLLPLVGTLKKAGHRGDFCVGAMIDKSGKSWPLEMTVRCGYPALFGQIASHKGDPAQWMRDFLDGKDTLRVSDDVCISVVLAQPQFPYENSTPEMVEGNPIGGITEENMDDLHFCEVMKAKGPVMKDGKIVEADTFQTSGEYVMIVTALGKTIKRARDKVYRTIDQIKFGNKIYRNDAGDKVSAAIPAMHKAGYALELEE